MNSAHPKFGLEFAELIDASNLRELAALLARITGNDRLSPKILQIEFVIDADAIVQTLMRKCQNPDFVSTFEELAASGVVIFHLPHWGVTEIENSALKQVSEKRGIQLDILRQEWRRLAHCFTVHEGYSYPHIRGWDITQKDWKDEPYATLQQNLAAKAVLSSNIDDMEKLGANVLPPSVLKEILDYARAETTCVTIKVGGVSVGAITAHGIESAVKSAPVLWAKTPNGLKWGALGIVAAALIYKPSREKIFKYASAGGSVALDFSSFLIKTYMESSQTAEKFKAAHV